MLPMWLKTGSAVILTLLIVNGYIQKYLNTRKMSNIEISHSGFSSVNIKTIQVGGMTCNHCKENVENSIKSVQGVENVTVDLTTGQVDIKGKSFDLEKIRSGITSIGYKIIKS
jgi:copper chaperone CopZ